MYIYIWKYMRTREHAVTFNARDLCFVLLILKFIRRQAELLKASRRETSRQLNRRCFESEIYNRDDGPSSD